MPPAWAYKTGDPSKADTQAARSQEEQAHQQKTQAAAQPEDIEGACGGKGTPTDGHGSGAQGRDRPGQSDESQGGQMRAQSQGKPPPFWLPHLQIATSTR